MHEYPWPRRFAFLLLVLLPCIAAASAAADDRAVTWTLVEEHWYAMQMGGLGSGWMHSAVHTDGERYRTSTSMNLSIARMGDAGEISGESTFIETAAGEPVKMSSRQVMSAQAMDSTWVFGVGSVQHTTRQGARETTREVDPPDGVWLTPRSVQKYVNERMKAGAEEITYRMITPENGLTPVKVTSKRAGEGTFSSNGKEVPVSIWNSTTSVMPIQTVEHYTADGVLVYQEMPTGIGTMTTRRVSKQEALNLELVEAPMPMLPETFVTPNQPMTNAMASRTATLVLRTKSGEMPAIPAAGAQRVEPGDDGTSVTLIIDIKDNLPVSDSERDDRAFLEASPMIDSDDAMIRALARRALREADVASTDDAMVRAEAMRAFVHGYITNPNLEVPFASASETARTRSGDCSEFAVLLAAMLRADGIAARVATGLVYADQFAGSDDIFGWHMWTQAIIDGKWVDFDATLPVRYHAGHVLTGTSSLADSQATAEMGTMMLLIGNLEIDVLEVGH